MPDVINITIRDKIAKAPNDALYICGNSDFAVAFDFDEEWNEHKVKTARFVCDGTHVDVVFEGNQCQIPVLSNTYSIKVGVYAGNLTTTTPAYISAKKSILCGSGVPADPQPDVYAQIMELLNKGGGSGEGGENGNDGISCTHEWNGTVLTITSASGTSSADLKGAKGEKGAAGYTPVRGKDYWTEADRTEMIASVLSALPQAEGGKF